MAKQNKKRIRTLLQEILSGQVLLNKMVMSNIPFIFSICVLVVLYITNGYGCIDETVRIEKLRQELKEIQYKQQVVAATLVGMSQKTEVKKKLEKEHSPLAVSPEPLYRIER